MHTFDPDWLKKLDELRSDGVQPYPDASEFPVTHLSTDLLERVGQLTDPKKRDLASSVSQVA